MVDPYSNQQLAWGFLPYRRRRGSCKFRGESANLWYAVAKALGFEIGTICCPDPLLVCQVADSVWGSRVWPHFRGVYGALPASWTSCSRTSQASRLARTLVNIGVHGRRRTFSTVPGLMIALIWMGHLVTRA